MVVEGRIVWVDEVGSMVEVGGKQIEIDDVEEDEGARFGGRRCRRWVGRYGG